MATNSKTEDTAWWAFDAGGNVHVANRDALLREADRLLDGRDLSRDFMYECVDLFIMTLCSRCGVVLSSELERTLEAAVREQARMLFAGELSGSTADGYDLRKREDARVWLADACRRFSRGPCSPDWVGSGAGGCCYRVGCWPGDGGAVRACRSARVKG